MSRESPFFLGGKIFLPKGDVFHSESLAPQVIQHPRVGGQVEVQLVGLESLTGLMVALVGGAVSVLADAQQGTAQ